MHLLLSPLRGLPALEANHEGVYYRKGQGNISHTTLRLAFSLRHNPQESYVWINHVLFCLHYGKISFLPFVSFAYINSCLWTPCVIERMTLKFCFYILSITCINYFSVAVRTIMPKTNKQKQTNKKQKQQKTQNQKGKNSTKKRKVCFSLRFQKASVQHSEESMSPGRSWKLCY